MDIFSRSLLHGIRTVMGNKLIVHVVHKKHDMKIYDTAKVIYPPFE